MRDKMNIWTILDKAAKLYAHDIAIIDRGQSYTYAKFRDRSLNLAAFFHDQGVRPADRIAAMEVNSVEFMEAYYAAAAIGAILTPINHRLSPKDLSYILTDSGSKWIIASTTFEKIIRDALESSTSNVNGIVWIGEQSASTPKEITHVNYAQASKWNHANFKLPRVDLDDVAHLYYTSGTTGEPKGVPLTHRNVVTHSECAVHELELTSDDIWGHIAPMFHLADAWAVFAITMVGGRHIMLDRFEAAAAMQIIEREKITISNLVPTMLNLMTSHKDIESFDFGSLKVILSGGAPIAKEVVRKIMKFFGCNYIQTYGMTETSPYLLLGILPDHLEALPFNERLNFKAKTGRRFKAVQLKVVDEYGTQVATDGKQAGEIWVRGETITKGYWNKPEATAEAFCDGWLKTGDLAVIDNELFVNIVDRKKDMILTGGENVYSTEVESTLYENEAVLEAAVFGLPDKTWGETVTAAVVLKNNQQISKDALINFCKKRLTSYKAPKQIFFIKELPKTGSGKISKKILKDLLAQK